MTHCLRCGVELDSTPRVNYGLCADHQQEDPMISKEKYPHLYKALEFIALENEQKLPEDLTLEYISETDCITADHVLSQLGEDELDTFCCGEEDAMNEILSRSIEMSVANTVLAAYFDSIQSDEEAEDDGEMEDEEAWSKMVVDSRRKKDDGGDTQDKFVEDDLEE